MTEPPPLVRHVRYEDFYALVSEGVRDLPSFRASVDVLLREMGNLHHHHILLDLRHAVIGPLPEAILHQAVSDLRALGIGVLNRVAIVTDQDDEIRTERVLVAEQIATLQGMHIRGFVDYGEALDWLNDPTEGP